MEHLQRLTDDTGIIQHAKYIIPARQHGYCTDDNARALIFITKYYKQNPRPEALKLFEIYLSFLYHAIKPDKTVFNFMDYNRNWQDGEPANDSIGRVIWALGTVIADCPNEDYIPMIKEFFTDISSHISSIPPRSKCYAIIGLAEFLKKFPNDTQMKDLLKNAANTIASHFNDSATSDWQWFEEILSYANAIMPAAMYTAALTLNNQNYLDIAERSCSFMLEHTYKDGHFSFVGSNGWHTKGQIRAQFDQQPIEAAYTVIMLTKAYQATNNKKYPELQKKAFEWFLGENDIKTPLYDPVTKGCRDGICEYGVNINQGAESTLSFLLARLFLI
ncbi:MAG TPA: hypothetical protein DDX75_05690 [Phycisphaerales bacterium]|nr:hypothetical protein [Phycisphaerales bacterium]